MRGRRAVRFRVRWGTWYGIGAFPVSSGLARNQTAVPWLAQRNQKRHVAISSVVKPAEAYAASEGGRWERDLWPFQRQRRWMAAGNKNKNEPQPVSFNCILCGDKYLHPHRSIGETVCSSSLSLLCSSSRWEFEPVASAPQQSTTLWCASSSKPSQALGVSGNSLLRARFQWPS